MMLVLALGVVLAACAPAVNARVVNPNHACYSAQQAEIQRTERLDLGYGSGVFRETFFTREGYQRITWWGYQNVWWVSFETGGPLGDRCVVSRGST